MAWQSALGTQRGQLLGDRVAPDQIGGKYERLVTYSADRRADGTVEHFIKEAIGS